MKLGDAGEAFFVEEADADVSHYKIPINSNPGEIYSYVDH